MVRKFFRLYFGWVPLFRATRFSLERNRHPPLNTRICILACHIIVATWTLFVGVLIAICHPVDITRIVLFHPKKFALPFTNLSPAKMTVVSDCLPITSLTHVQTCSFTSLCCFLHFLSMLLHILIYRRAQLYLYLKVKILTCVFQPTTAVLL
jgi:hypothetical protein